MGFAETCLLSLIEASDHGVTQEVTESIYSVEWWALQDSPLNP